VTGFTLCLPYYENPGMLVRQIQTWNAYDAATRDAVRVIVVDDGSPEHPAEPVIRANPCALKINLFRIAENIPWNQHGARNLAAKAASPGWLLMTDMDHLLEAPEAKKVVAANLKPQVHYIFDRVSLPERAPYKHHCNSFLVDRDAYWRAGGYDEDYCGSYGGDGPFLRALANVAPERRLKVTIVRVPREVIPDAVRPHRRPEGSLSGAAQEEEQGRAD
jgi:glycosyltransferase involved in cell wall biosynthesis